MQSQQEFQEWNSLLLLLVEQIVKASLKIASVSGIHIKIHWTFLILIAWVIYIGLKDNQDKLQILFMITLVLVIFLCVTLHELGHALMAKRFNIETLGITLLPIGGVASMKRIPEDPRQELLVAAAGPMVNVIIAIALGVYMFLATTINLNADNMVEILSKPLSFNAFILNVFAANVLLVAFNLLPAFPMDGGRMLRALLSFKMDRVVATNIAAKTGQLFAMAFVLYGLLSPNPVLIFVGVFVYIGAMYENSMVQTSGLLRGFTIKDVMRTEFKVLSENTLIKEAAGVLIAGSEQDFLVVDASQNVKGVLTRKQLFKAIKERREEERISVIMEPNFNAVKASDSLDKTLENKAQMNFLMMPVYDNGTLAGVLDKENLGEFIMLKNAGKA